MRSVTLRQPVRWFTNEICAVTIVVVLSPEPFKMVIWCSGSSRIKLMHTSYPHLGKGPLWSARTWTTGHTTLSMFERTKTHVSRRRRSAGHGMLLIFGLTTHEPPALMMYIFLSCIYYDDYNKAGSLLFYLQRIMCLHHHNFKYQLGADHIRI